MAIHLKRPALGFVIFFSLTQNVMGWQDTDSLTVEDPDDLFTKGREAAFAGNREQGRRYLLQALEIAPEYTDVRIFLARTYLWDEMKAKAEETVRPVLEKDPDYTEAILVMFDAAFWNKDNHSALQWAERGLKNNATSKELLIKRAQALGALERFDDAVTVLDGLLQRFPGDKDVLQLRNDFKVNLKPNSLTAMATYDFYTDKTFGNASLHSLQYGRRTGIGAFFVRANQSQRFGTSGWQGEIDAYPTLSKHLYGYLNYGYSQSPLFPEHRVGAELFANLPAAFETSLGVRYLYFGPAANVVMYTGTLGKYIGSYWFSARVYVTPDEAIGVSTSALFQARRYFTSANHFVSISGGFGFSPELRNLQSNEGLSTQEIYRLKSSRVGIIYQHPLNSTWQLSGTFDYARQEFIFDTNNFVGIWSAGLWVRYSF